MSEACASPCKDNDVRGDLVLHVGHACARAPSEDLWCCIKSNIHVVTAIFLTWACMHAQGELADMMEGGGTQEKKGPAFTREELRALFRLDTGSGCETARIMAQSATAAGDWQARMHADSWQRFTS